MTMLKRFTKTKILDFLVVGMILTFGPKITFTSPFLCFDLMQKSNFHTSVEQSNPGAICHVVGHECRDTTNPKNKFPIWYLKQALNFSVQTRFLVRRKRKYLDNFNCHLRRTLFGLKMLSKINIKTSTLCFLIVNGLQNVLFVLFNNA